MSVLIKGLTIPTVGVRHCVISFNGGRLLISDVCGNSIFEGNYVEILTPHGRLIDADKFLKDNAAIADKSLINLLCRGTLRDLIDSAPTIVEAEVSE